MKRWLIGLVALLAIFLGAVNIFIPKDMAVSKAILIHCTPKGSCRLISDRNLWKLNWLSKNDSAGKPLLPDSSYMRSQTYCEVTQKFTNGAEILIHTPDFSIPSKVEIFSKGKDSIVCNWSCLFSVTGWNPFKKIQYYRRALMIKHSMDRIVENLRDFLEQPDNIYHMAIRMQSITDTLLVATRGNNSQYPTTADIYRIMEPLQNYAFQQGALVSGNPMVNITRYDKNHFEIMTALPVNKELPVQGKFFPRKMIPGNFMVTEVQGGPASIENAFKQISLYFDDYQKTSMAIPFQYLITDRMKVTDTSRWVTRIYAPVMK